MLLVGGGLFLAVSALFAIASLFASVRAHASARSAPSRRRSAMAWSCLVILVAVCAPCGVSFTVHVANVAALVLALIGGAVLALHSMRLTRRWLAILATVGITAACIVVILVYAVLFAMDGTPSFGESDDGLHCRMTPGGFAGDLSGATFELFQRYGPIDFRLYQFRQWDNFPEQEIAAPAKLRGPVADCMLALESHRH